LFIPSVADDLPIDEVCDTTVRGAGTLFALPKSLGEAPVNEVRAKVQFGG
jgi:hypothetical protein